MGMEVKDALTVKELVIAVRAMPANAKAGTLVVSGGKLILCTADGGTYETVTSA